MSDGLVKQPIIWVDNNEHLERLCESWQDLPMLAIDTEFMRSRTYYPEAGLIQVNDGKQNALIDPTQIDDFYPLIDVFDDDNILKVLHSCSEDLDVFQYTFGCVPKCIFDTQIAAAMAGYGFSVGFANLTRAALSIDLPKGETRSDWLARPLSQSQIAYAAIDVEYLFTVAEHLIDCLTNNGRLAWAREESEAMIKHYFANQDASNSYLKVKSAWKLQPRQLYTLKALCQWRENLAQDKNLPRNRIIKEPALFSIAMQGPQDLSQLKKYEGFTERMIRNHGRDILAIIAQSKDVDAQELPDRLPKPFDKETREFLKILKEEVVLVAEKHDMPAEILVKKKDYEQLVVGMLEGSVRMPESLEGWRKGLVGEMLAARIRDHLERAS